jgi:hypothetical protein
MFLRQERQGDEGAGLPLSDMSNFLVAFMNDDIFTFLMPLIVLAI